MKIVKRLVNLYKVIKKNPWSDILTVKDGIAYITDTFCFVSVNVKWTLEDGNYKLEDLAKAKDKKDLIQTKELSFSRYEKIKSWGLSEYASPAFRSNKNCYLSIKKDYYEGFLIDLYECLKDYRANGWIVDYIRIARYVKAILLEKSAEALIEIFDIQNNYKILVLRVLDFNFMFQFHKVNRIPHSEYPDVKILPFYSNQNIKEVQNG